MRDQRSALTLLTSYVHVYAIRSHTGEYAPDAKAEDMAVTEPSPLNNDIKGPLKEKEKNMKMVTLMPSSDGEGLSILTDSQAGNSITVPQPLRLNHTRRTYLLTITQAVQPRSARLTYSLTH